MSRKTDHINLALLQEKKENSFDEFKIKYYSLPLFSKNEVCLKTKIGNIELDFPFFINAMTGGDEFCDNINKELEEVAKKCNIFIFSGSASPFLKNEEKRPYLTNYGSNLGIDKDFLSHKKAIEIFNSKIHQIHLNPIQEMLMLEGNKNFETWRKNLIDCLKNLDVDIILKETGFGMNSEMISKFYNMGVKIIDISGKDGTDFARIENNRSNNKNKKYYEEIGYSTTNSLINAKDYIDKMDIIASGGIRNPLDIIKALALGAKAVGVSKTFLEVLIKDGKEELINTIEEWKKDIVNIMILTHSKNIKELRGKIEK